jgi:hypothetical protein
MNFSVTSRSFLGSSQPPVQWVPGTHSRRMKWPEREADQSPASIAYVKNANFYLQAPQYLHAWCLVTQANLPLPDIYSS